MLLFILHAMLMYFLSLFFQLLLLLFVVWFYEIFFRFV